MLVQQHIEQLIKLAAPHLFYPLPNADDRQDQQSEFTALLSEIKPVKFGNTALWSAATQYDLASYQVPRNAEYMAIMRVECYTVNLTAGATDYGLYQPPPPGAAYWQLTASGTGISRIVSDQDQQSQNMLDVDEFRFFKSGNTVSLIGDFLVSPDGNTRNVCTRVYAYLVGTQIMERLGGLDIFEPPSIGV